MQTPDFKFLLREPARTGVITAFSALSAAAAINLAIGFALGEASTLGTAGLMLALAVSGVAGIMSSIMMARVKSREKREFEMITALGKGDFSKSIITGSSEDSPIHCALKKIADRELEFETERARLSKDAANRQDQLEDALDSVPDAIAVYSCDGILVMANTAFIAECNNSGAVIALGMTRNDVLSALAKAPGANLPLNERQTWINYQEGLRQDALASGVPIRFTQSNGMISDIRVIRAKDGNQTEISRDISAIVDLEDKAQRAQREASAAESIKQVTLSRLSHTIRTPMTGVLAATELLSETELDVRQRERLDIIRRSASTLLGVVQDMFDIAANVTVKDKAIADSVPQAQRSVLVLKSLDAEIHEDIDKLGDQGFEVGSVETVEILIEALKVLAAHNRSPEIIYVPDLEAFNALQYALDCAQMKTQSDIRVLSAKATIVPEQPILVQSKTGPLDVLIAESDEINQIAFANAMSVSGLTYQICTKGKEALEVAKARTPKLLLIDISLSDMDGFETTAALRKHPKSATRFGPIVAMTSHYVQGDMAKCLANGMDGYVLKPTIGEDMVNLARDWLSREPIKKAG